MEVEYEDFVGFKFFGPFGQMFRACGIHVRTLNDVGSPRSRANRLFGSLMMTVATIQMSLITMATMESIKREDYEDITNVISYMSMFLSCACKFYVARSKWKVIHRLGTWLKQVRAKGIENTENSRIRVLMIWVNRAFFSTCVIIVVLWTVAPLARPHFKPLIPIKYPLLDAHASYIIYLIIQAPTFLFQSGVIAYVATLLLTLIAVFVTEAKVLSAKFARLSYDPAHPNRLKETLKMCVDENNTLLTVMNDMNIIHDSLFGYQVVIFTAHCVSFIYALLATNDSHAVVSILPLAVMSTVDFALICWVGDEISYSLAEFHTNIYMTNWHEAPLKDMKNMVLAQEMLKKRHVLTGATVFTASLSTFVEAVKQSFSLYTMMKILTKG